MNYYRDITVDHTKVGSGGVSDFAVYIDINLNSNVISSSGYDVSFMDSSGASNLFFYLEKWDNSSKRWQGWVKVPSLSSSIDTAIRVYYGDASVASDQSSTQTWSEFAGVWFMSEGSVGVSSVKDKTSSANNMSPNGTQLAPSSDGKLTSSIERGSSTAELSRLVTDGNLNIPTGSWTVLGWIYKTQNTPVNGQWIWQVDNGYIRSHSNTQTWRSYTSPSQLLQQASGTVSNNAWHRSAARHVSGQGLHAHLDGTLVGSATTNLNPYLGTNTPMALFQSATANQPFIGRISHFFIATKDLGEAWIETDFANQNESSSFYSIGAETPVSAGGVTLKVFDGTSFVQKPLKVWTGTEWAEKTLRTWDGTKWIPEPIVYFTLDVSLLDGTDVLG